MIEFKNFIKGEEILVMVMFLILILKNVLFFFIKVLCFNFLLLEILIVFILLKILFK